jgi:hypothetical protein
MVRMSTGDRIPAERGAQAGSSKQLSPPGRQGLIASLVLTFLGLSIMAAVFWPTRDLILRGKNDFIPPYVAAGLAGTGELYHTDAYYDFMTRRFGESNESLRYTGPPFYAALLAPLRLLSFGQAYVVWWILRLAALGAFLVLWETPSRMITALFIALSLPVFGSLASGQDTIFLLLFLAAAFRCWERGKGFQAGLVLSLCAIKFHLLVLLPLLFWRRRLGRMASGFASGAAFFLLLSFAVEGWSWPQDYFRVLTDPRVHPEFASMPNLHGLLAELPYGTLLEAFAVFAVVAVAWIALPAATFPQGLSLALTGGLLLSYHSYLMDAAILLPALLIVFETATLPGLKLAGAVLLSPPAALFLVSLRPMSYFIQIALVLFFFALAADSLRKQRAAASTTATPQPELAGPSF